MIFYCLFMPSFFFPFPGPLITLPANSFMKLHRYVIKGIAVNKKILTAPREIHPDTCLSSKGERP